MGIILIGDSITEHVRMAKTENLTMADKPVRERTELLSTLKAKANSEMGPATEETEWLSVTTCIHLRSHYNFGEGNEIS